ncbi:MAG: hypothetical protein PUB98_09700 [Clostridiales bacterium]|nr:hypothetical protein [Clostridiales bacterium]
MKTQVERSKRFTNEHYIDGNTVRRTIEAPDPFEAERLRRVRRERYERERQEELERKRRMARRLHERELRRSRRSMAALTVLVTMFAITAGAYINLQSDITTRMRTISNLESKIATLKADNDEAYKRINTAVDLESIKEKAMTELGMSYAKESQIIYYTVGAEDYMNQYGEIPKE